MRPRDFLAVLALVACVVLVFSQGYSPDSRKSGGESSEESLSDYLFEEKLSPTTASIVASVERPKQLKDLVIQVECRGAEGFEVGFESGEPVAFFMINREDELAAIAGFVRRTDDSESSDQQEALERYSPPEVSWLRYHSFTLTIDAFFPFDSSELLLEDSESADEVELYVYVWLDGGWRTCRFSLSDFLQSKRLQVRDRTAPYNQFILDEFWKRTRQKENE